MEKEPIELRDFVSVVKLSDNYEGVKIIGEPEIRSVKEHNKLVIERAFARKNGELKEQEAENAG